SDLKNRLPDALLTGRTRVVASGNALRRNALLFGVAEEIFEQPVELRDSQEEAACGAAILARRAI
ncbi:MAG: hypothetical protein KAG97_02105, partial [Victivallales bacterium]|nr:hypothetical protein [Victivallales bacterium]